MICEGLGNIEPEVAVRGEGDQPRKFTDGGELDVAGQLAGNDSCEVRQVHFDWLGQRAHVVDAENSFSVVFRG